MKLKRRNFLLFIGTSLGSLTIGSCLAAGKRGGMPLRESTAAENYGDSLTRKVEGLSFQPIATPIPLEVNGLTDAEQIAAYSTYEVKDDLVLPEGFTYDVIAAWGDRVGDSRFGYNNDYLSFVETSPHEGLLTVNFEYISGKVWQETYPLVIGQELPLREVKAAAAKNEGTIDAFSLPESDPLRAKIAAIAREGLIDQGIGVISLKRNPEGKWVRTFSPTERRITGISGLDNPQQSLQATGPAVAVFQKKNKLGYDDGLGDRLIGTWQNCAGGTTPWGTVLSAEENFQDQVPEAVMADGSSLNPSVKPFIFTDEEIDGRGNVFGFAGNKYGWMVEVDPANPHDYGTKHTWLGRYRHEAFGIRAESGKKLAIYSGCDRRGGHIYKFISSGTVTNPQDKANSRLFEQGMLYGAKFNADGTGKWIPLSSSTPVDPVLPSQVAGNLVQLPNPDRTAGGNIPLRDDAQVRVFKQQFPTLGDLYQGDTDWEKQGAILIDAHFAANAAGITCTARPEDTIIAPDGTLYLAFTSGTPGGDGGSALAIFKGPEEQTAYEYGWIVKLQEEGNEPSSLSFRWSIFALGGEPAQGGAGFANPDNLEIDPAGNLWMVTDMSTSVQNQAVPRRQEGGKTLSETALLGIFGNNSLWFLPTSGANAGEAYPVAMGPMECECTGPFFSRDRQTLFLSIQHPGERYGMRQNLAAEVREFELMTTGGQAFVQKRTVPIGSNWPGKGNDEPPRPAVVAIRRLDSQAIS